MNHDFVVLGPFDTRSPCCSVPFKRKEKSSWRRFSIKWPEQTDSFQRVTASDIRESILAHEGVTVQSLRWWQVSQPRRPVGCGPLPPSRGLPSYICCQRVPRLWVCKILFTLSFHWGYLRRNPLQEGRPPVPGVELPGEQAPPSSRPRPSSRPFTARHSQGLFGRHLCITKCQACAPWTTTTEVGLTAGHVWLPVIWPAHPPSPTPQSGAHETGVLFGIVTGLSQPHPTSDFSAAP